MPNHQDLVREPIYQQVNHLLRSLIGSREFPAGRKFLTEREISDRFGVSRPTANKALSSLVSAGLLEFRRGVGTFVLGKTMDYNLRALVSFTSEAAAAGKTPSTRVISSGKLLARELPAEVATALGLTPEEPVYAVERLRKVDDLPVILERRWISCRYCPELTPSDYEGSLYAAWTNKYALEVEGADQRIRAVNLRGTDARILEVREDAAGLLVISVGYLTGRRPLWFERTQYRGDAYEFQNQMGGIEATASPSGTFLDRDPPPPAP
jgi:GntR family transcriptional regulator